MRSIRIGLISIAIIALAVQAHSQMAPQNPSPSTETTRPHTRVARVDVPGERTELKSLTGAVLFVPEKSRVKIKPPEGGTPSVARKIPLVIHFHGAPWLVQKQISDEMPKAALVTINLGSGSRAYGGPFAAYPVLFKSVIDEAAAMLNLKNGFSSITLIGFSAGYGAIRQILRQPDNFKLVDNVLLLDGIHASYVPEGKPLGAGGVIRDEDLDSYLAFAREASKGRKSFVITHSELFPGTYASTTECVDYLIAKLELKRTPKLKHGPIGMQQLSEVNVKGFKIRGYAGNTGIDHGDHLYAMPAWLKLLKIE
ncbi:MAG: hypothetical protein IPN69_23855 [Acidobacteria bacterium]|nr:hypothetical protein [Acidobacteriota bacterium]